MRSKIMQNRIEKVLRLSKEYKAIWTSEKINICDNKGNIEKTFENKNSDLFKVKNSDLIAFVEFTPSAPQGTRPRRDAISGYSLLGKGKTTLIDSEKLTVIKEISYPLENPLALQENKVIAGMCGSRAVCYVLESNRLCIDDNPMFATNRDIFVLSDTHLGFLNMYPYKTDTSTLNVYSFGRKQNPSLDWIEKYMYVCGISSLTNGRFFMHWLHEGVYKSGIYEYDNIKKLVPIHETKQSPHIIFSELLLLADNVTLIGRSTKNIFYLIDTDTLAMEALPFKLDSIVHMALTKEGNLIGVMSDGRYLDLDQRILEHSKTHAVLYRDTYYPLALINIIAGYAGNYGGFFDAKPSIPDMVEKKPELNAFKKGI
jgi:hypothetical protein